MRNGSTCYNQSDKGKAICVRDDDDLNSNCGDTLGFHDDYFGCRINEENPFVARFVPTELVGSYEHPLQICATSTPINERINGFNPTPITGSNPTPEETVPEEVANEDYGVPEEDDGEPRITGFNLTPITSFNPTPEETVPEEVANKYYGVPEEYDGVPRITGFNPTPITGLNPTREETVPEEVANEDYGVPEEDDSRLHFH